MLYLILWDEQQSLKPPLNFYCVYIFTEERFLDSNLNNWAYKHVIFDIDKDRPKTLRYNFKL